MVSKEVKANKKVARGTERIPEGSVFYEKMIPLMLIGMTILLLVIIVASLGVVFGVFDF